MHSCKEKWLDCAGMPRVVLTDLRHSASTIRSRGRVVVEPAMFMTHHLTSFTHDNGNHSYYIFCYFVLRLVLEIILIIFSI